MNVCLNISPIANEKVFVKSIAHWSSKLVYVDH